MAKKKLYFNEGGVLRECKECDTSHESPLMWISSPTKKKAKQQIIELLCKECGTTNRVSLPLESYKKHKDMLLK